MRLVQHVCSTYLRLKKKNWAMISINCLYLCVNQHRQTYLGGIPGPPTVEFVKVYRGALHKNEQNTISLLVGGGLPPRLIYVYIYI